jgi:hypothetical protein
MRYHLKPIHNKTANPLKLIGFEKERLIDDVIYTTDIFQK